MTTATATKTLPRAQGSATATRSRPRCSEQFSYGNVMQIPRLVKIVVNMGVGEAARDAKLIDGAVRDLTAITGQKPQVRRATQVHRAVQAARGHADRREGHPARRPDVGVPGPAAVDRAAAYPRLPRPGRRASSTATATTRSV